jgi:hypothetical protein
MRAIPGRGRVARMARRAWTAWALVLLAPISVAAATGPTAPRVQYRDDRLTAHVEGAPLHDVLAAIARATGAQVRGQPLDDRPVSIELDAVPLDDALHRVLGSQNFTVSYARDGRPRTVLLLGGPEAPPPMSDRPTAAGVPVAAPAPTGPAFPLPLSRALMRARPVPVPEPLAEVLGTDRATFPELLELATVDDDGIRRAQATQAVLSALERQSRLRRSFLRTLHDLDEESLQAIVAGDGGPRFVDILTYLAVHSRERALQKKATVILDQLQPADPTAPGM